LEYASSGEQRGRLYRTPSKMVGMAPKNGAILLDSENAGGKVDVDRIYVLLFLEQILARTQSASPGHSTISRVRVGALRAG